MPAGSGAEDQALSPPASGHSRPSITSPWLIAGLTVIVDQLTKQLIASTFVPGQSLPLVPAVLHLTYVQNTGAAFGIFKGQQMVFVGLSVLVVGWIVRELLTRPSAARPIRWACALILGGATGNVIDRLRFGYVVDFIDVRVWPVFNVADSAITVGIGLLLWRSLSGRRRIPS